MKFTPIEILVQAISSMDVKLVESLLSDEYIYLDATKVVFIDKITNLFNKYKELENDKLKVVSGNCISSTCHNKGCNGYLFYGNVSKNYFNFFFTEKNNKIIKIEYCHEFQKKIFTSQLNEELKLEVLIHESFYYQILLNENNAYKDLLSLGKNDVYTLSSIKKWLNKYDYNTFSFEKIECNICDNLFCICGKIVVYENLLELYKQLELLSLNIGNQKSVEVVADKLNNQKITITV